MFTSGVQITVAFQAVQPVFEEKSVCGAHKRVAKPLNFLYVVCMNMGSFFSFSEHIISLVALGIIISDPKTKPGIILGSQ